ncbi:PIG-L deacetylase family protein [Lentzea sp. NPDC042327]|uniref:PIG-L deacetylase family protein n=1 Tax=Lentzea sp. NPDC042327 TaxID=3154801 RepID=UPI0033C68EC5
MHLPVPRTLLVLHAHSGDESATTGGALALYSRQGVRTVLVTCTGPAQNPELQAAADVLGVTDLEALGYLDSGEDGEVGQGGFCAIPVNIAASRVAALVERYRPQVVVTHHGAHRDHVHAVRVAKSAVYRTGIPAKLYLTAGGGATTIDIDDVADVKRKAVQCYPGRYAEGAFAVQEHYFRDLDTTNAPLPETDLFAGVTNCGPDLPR